jgi:hypothetical protein
MENEHRRSYALIDSILGSYKGETPFLDEKVSVISKWRGIGHLHDGSDLREILSKAIFGTILSEGLVFNTLFSFFIYL